jgi:(4S)-4-hydroxy-5-phosphonooxypentane-2,3-dione isomerase
MIGSNALNPSELFGARTMAKLALIAVVKVAPGKWDQLVASLVAHRVRCLKDEPGTLQMEVVAPRDDDAKLFLYEVYRDDAAFDLHRKGPSLAQWRKESAETFVEFSVTRCTPIE